jgi:hypothetical protein
MVRLESRAHGTVLAHITHHSHHGHPAGGRVGGIVERNSRPDRVASRPVSLSQPVADDGNRGAVEAIAGLEQPAAEQGKAERVEVLRAGSVHHGVLHHLGRGLFDPGNSDAPVWHPTVNRRVRAERGGGDARERPRAIQQRIPERHLAPRVVVAGAWQGDAGRQNPVDGDAGIHPLQAHEASEQQRRPDQQHRGQRHLREHQCVPGARGRACPGECPSAFGEATAEIEAECPDRRHHAEHQAGADREDERERQRAPIESNLLQARHRARLERAQRVHAPHCDPEPEDAAGQRQQHALGEELPQQASPRGPERRANGHLALAVRHPDQHEVGHIGAGDEQDQRHRAEKDEQRRADLAHDPLLQSDQLHTPAGIARRILGLEPSRDRRQLRPRGLDGDARRQPADHLQEVVAAAQ